MTTEASAPASLRRLDYVLPLLWRALSSAARALAKIPIAPLMSQPMALTGAQIVDPQNATTVATNLGTHTATVHDLSGNAYTGRVWSTFADLVAAWTTLSPDFSRPVQVVFASSHTDASDPVVLDPIIGNATTGLSIIGASDFLTPTPATLTVVHAKDRTTGANNALQAEGPTAAGQLIHNTTRGTWAWAYRLVTGTTYMLTQPLPLQTPSTYNPAPAEDDTWTTGDALLLYEPIAVYIAALAPLNVSASLFGGEINLVDLVMFDPSGIAGTTPSLLDTTRSTINAMQVRVDVSLETLGTEGGAPGDSIAFTNCGVSGSLIAQGAFVVGGYMTTGPGYTGGANFFAGGFGNSLDGDVILGNGASATTALSVLASLGFVCLDAPLSLGNASFVLSLDIAYGGSVVYASTTAGTENIIMQGTSRLVIAPGSTATACYTFPAVQVGGFVMNGQQGEATFTSTAAGTGTLHTNQSTNVGAIDAVIAAGEGGISSFAAAAGGASIVPNNRA